MRKFATGATRNSDEGKLDFDGFFSGPAMRRFAEYMNSHRKQADGELRASDNWQKGIPMPEYRKSAWRHFFDFWELARAQEAAPLTPAGEDALEEAATALWFNIQGYLHEHLKAKHGTWSYLMLKAAAEADARNPQENDDYQPDTRPTSEGMMDRASWPSGPLSGGAAGTITVITPSDPFAYAPGPFSPYGSP